jgi:putative salt-induced outer membrane protein YdiY
MRQSFLLSTLTLLPCAVTIDSAIAEEPATYLWRQQVELGLNGASGNSDTLSIHVGFNSDYADPEKNWKFKSAYDRAKSSGDVSANRLFADLKREWIWPDIPWFSFLQGRYDWDEFKDWDDRFSASSGIGYQHLKDETWDIATRLGLGGSVSRGVDEDDSTPELVLAFDLGWIISEYERFEFNNALYPDLDETGEYRNLTAINWAIKMAEARNLAIKLGLQNEYDSNVTEDKEKNDFTYNLSLLWQI